EPDLRVRRDLVVNLRHGFYLLMVRRDARSHEPVGRRQPVEYVYLEVVLRAFQQMLGRVKTGRSRADNGDSYSIVHLQCSVGLNSFLPVGTHKKSFSPEMEIPA